MLFCAWPFPYEAMLQGSAVYGFVPPCIHFRQRIVSYFLSKSLVSSGVPSSPFFGVFLVLVLQSTPFVVSFLFCTFLVLYLSSVPVLFNPVKFNLLPRHQWPLQ